MLFTCSRTLVLSPPLASSRAYMYLSVPIVGSSTLSYRTSRCAQQESFDQSHVEKYVSLRYLATANCSCGFASGEIGWSFVFEVARQGGESDSGSAATRFVRNMMDLLCSMCIAFHFVVS